MHTTRINGTDLLVSSLCLGSADMGGAINREVSYSILNKFADLGGNFIDTAKIYNDWIPGERSRSEKIIGEWVKSRRNRDNIVLATKGAHFNLETPQIQRLSQEDIQADVEASLSHLQTDRIDLYWLHRDDPTHSVAEILYTLDELIKSGKIRYYGLSNWSAHRLQQALTHTRTNHIQPVSAVQNMWSLASIVPHEIADPTIVVMDQALWDFHNSFQVTAIPYSSQANGLFQKMANGTIESLSRSQLKVYINPETERRFRNVLRVCEQTGLTITQVVLGYLLSQPFPTIPVFSSRSLTQLEDTLTAADVRLTPEQVLFLQT